MSTTMELVLLDEGGQFVASLRPTVTSAPEFVKFENRHYRRTGKLRDSPEEWQYVRAHTVSGRKDCVVFIGDGCPVWRTGDPPMITTTHGDAPSVVTGNGLRYVYAPGFDSGATATDDRDTTIAEQAAEIEVMKTVIGKISPENTSLRIAVEHLKGERDTLRSALEIAAARSDSQNASIAYFEQESASHDAALAELTTERDVLRLEYAALEAERDELRAERLERMGALEAAMRTIDAQNAQVRAMNEQLDAVTQLIVLRVKDTDHA